LADATGTLWSITLLKVGGLWGYTLMADERVFTELITC
jgi:hypothetical protein